LAVILVWQRITINYLMPMRINVNQLHGNSCYAGRQGWPWMSYFQLGLTQADRRNWGSVDRFPDGNEEETVMLGQQGSFHLSIEDDELLTEQGILYNQIGTAAS
jgi:hypothetical protein